MSDKLLVTSGGVRKVIANTAETQAKLRERSLTGEPYDGPEAVGTYLTDDDQDGDQGQPETPTQEAQEAPPPPAPAPPRPRMGLMDAAKKVIGQGVMDAGDNAFMRGLRNGATLGWDDEIAKYAGALGARLAGSQDPNNTYAGMDAGDSVQQTVRQNQEASRAEHPVLYGGGQILGGAATSGGAMAPLGKAVQGMSALNRGATLVGANSAMGAAQGAGTAAPDERTTGALWGGGIGAAGQLAGEGAAIAADKVGPYLAPLAAKLRTGVANPVQRVREALQQKYGIKEGDEYLGKLLEKHFPPNGKARSASDYLAATEKQLGDAGGRIGDSLERAGTDDMLDEIVPQEWEKTALDYASRAEGKAGKSIGNQATSEVGQNMTYADRMTHKPDPIPDPEWWGNANPGPPVQPPRVVNEKTAPKTIKQWWDKGREIQEDVNYTGGATVPDNAKAMAAHEAATAVKGRVKDLVQEHASPEVAEELAKQNQRFHELSMLKDSLAHTSGVEASGQNIADTIAAIQGGGASGAITAMATGVDPITGAFLGAQGAAATGTRNLTQRMLSGSKSKDRAANYIQQKLAPRLAEFSKSGSGATQATVRTTGVTATAPKESTALTVGDRVRDMMNDEAGMQRLGPYGENLRTLYDDEEAFHREVERLDQEDPRFHALIAGGTQ